MAIVRTLIILALVGLILGGSAFFAYELYWKPRKLDMEDRALARSHRDAGLHLACLREGRGYPTNG